MPHLTDQACACGCGNLLLSTIADRGWRYIRGHKPVDAPKVHKRLPDNCGPVTSTDMRSVFDFLSKRVLNDLQFCRELVGKINSARHDLSDMELRESKLKDSIRDQLIGLNLIAPDWVRGSEKILKEFEAFTASMQP
jgi:hypothetical protein